MIRTNSDDLQKVMKDSIYKVIRKEEGKYGNIFSSSQYIRSQKNSHINHITIMGGQPLNYHYKALEPYRKGGCHEGEKLSYCMRLVLQNVSLIPKI